MEYLSRKASIRSRTHDYISELVRNRIIHLIAFLKPSSPPSLSPSQSDSSYTGRRGAISGGGDDGFKTHWLDCYPGLCRASMAVCEA